MSWLWYVLAALWIFDGLRMRTRIKAMQVLPASSDRVPEHHRFLTTPGVELNQETRAAASAFAEEKGLELLDLIPEDLPALMGLAIAQLVEPRRYRANRVAIGQTAGFAVLVSDQLAERARETIEQVYPPEAIGPIVRKFKRFAFDRADMAIAPNLKSNTKQLSTNWTVLMGMVGGNSHRIFMLRAIMLLLIVAGLIFTPKAGLAALAALHLQALLAFAGTAVHPRDLLVTVLFRTPIELLLWIQTLRSRLRTSKERLEPFEARRPYYEKLLAGGTAQFLDPRRDDCPLCGSRNLKVRIRNIDLIQQKPGVFTLEQCQSCGHTFQNPRISPAGLNFYYSDFYDGLGGSVAETIFSARPGLYLGRARVVEGLSEPTHWLDVGTGQGHFCSAAREHWKQTTFDGLDISDVDDAVRAGWLDHGYHGFFSEVAPTIPESYDVISLFHCLEHTPNPRAELAAAHTVLMKDGLLVIENPNPECVFGKILGRFWLPWFQPQHLNMPTVDNLKKLLKEEGFDTVRVQLAEAHLPIDIFSSVMMFYGWLSPKINLPWRPRPKWFDYARQFVVWNLGFPFIVLALVLDNALAPFCRMAGISNAFRLVARRVEKPSTVDAFRLAAEHSPVYAAQ